MCHQSIKPGNLKILLIIFILNINICVDPDTHSITKMQMSDEKFFMTSKIKSEFKNSCKKMRFNENGNETCIIKEEIDLGAGGDYNYPQSDSYEPPPKRVFIENSLPQIAIKKKTGNSSNPHTEVVLLNGNWDTSNTIPNIVAEMHNVKLEELQSTWVGDTGDSFFVDSHDPLKLKSEAFSVPSASPQGSDSGLGNDSPEGNLSWLLNFKLDEIPGLPDCSSQVISKKYTPRKTYDNQNKASPIYIAETIPKQYFDQHHVQNVNVARIIHEQSNTSKEDSLTTPTKPTVSTNATRFTPVRKPPFTYTELIEHALREKGELTVSGIYQWISDHFSFYKANDDRWKNSVRHNLSINPHFRKGSKAVHGAGHLWTIAQKDDTRNNSSWNAKRQRMQQFMQTAANEWQQQQQQEMELAVATASIMPETDNFENNVQVIDAQNHAQIQQTANEILGGMKREVEVQYIIPVNNSMDFMCPVSKEQVAQECGLGGEEIQVTENDYLITDLNPNTLGLNLSEAEIITSDQLFSDDLNFQCYELQTEQ